MLCKINRGPHFGEIRHFPTTQEVHALILLGDLEPIEDEALKRANSVIPERPPRGWKILNLDATGIDPKIAVAFDDGMGGRTIVLDKVGNPCVPGPQRVWKYDPDTQTEGYIMIPSDCPAEVIAEFKRLGGGAPNNPDADLDAGSAYRQRLAEQEAAQASQNRLANTFLRVQGVRK